MKLATSWRFWLLIICLLFSIWLIQPQFDATGVAIKAVQDGSPADLAGIAVARDAKPTQLEHIIAVNGVEITNLAEFYTNAVGDTVFLETSGGTYVISNIIGSTVTDNLTNSTTNTTTTPAASSSSFGLELADAPTSNIKTGIELSGGVRILLEPERELESSEIGTMSAAIIKRLNVFGLADISVRYASGSSNYFVVEMASSSLTQVEELLSKQGKFEAKMLNQTAYSGEDVRVNKDPLLSGVVIESCGPIQTGEYGCQYQFPVTLSEAAAKNMARITSNVSVSGTHLSEQLYLYLDDVLVNDLSVASSLKGKAVQQISISGYATGSTREEAILNGQDEMIEFMGLLESGNLPSRLTVVKADRLSPSLGATFLDNALTTGMFCLLFVAVIIYIRYRRLMVVIPTIITVISEVVILLGFAALSGWNIDVAGIAGFIIILGTGLDHLIIITDELLSAKPGQFSSMKGRLRRAFRVIMTAFFTTIVAMLPLYFSGAGLLRGFATTTIVGLVIAIFITRPAYAAVLELYLRPAKK